MVYIVSSIFSGLALIVSLYAALTANTSAAASIRSTNCSTIFDDYLIKKIPQARTALRFDSSGYLCNGNNLCDVLANMNMSALFYKYDDNVFFKELTHHCGMLEDIVVEAGNHPRSSENEQRIFGQEVQKQLETIYNLIDKKRIGKKS